MSTQPEQPSMLLRLRSLRLPERRREELVAAGPGWVTARIAVAAAWALAAYIVDKLHSTEPASLGLLRWDAAFYLEIARNGYDALAQSALRFFPLVPGMARGMHLFGVPTNVALLLIANASALIAGMLLYRLARHEGMGVAAGTRAAWLFALSPAAFTFVMGYADATAAALVIGAFLCLRRRQWATAAVIGVFAGLVRPNAFLLALPALIEVTRGWDGAALREKLERVAAVIAAPFGTALFLAWVGFTYSDPLLPYSVQTDRQLKGSFANPFVTLERATRGLLNGNRVGTGLHVLWIALAIGLLVVCARRLPASYTAYALVVVASALVSDNLDSFERYAIGAFPLVIAAAHLTSDPRVERVVFVSAGVTMSSYAVLAMLHAYVP